MKGIIRKSFLLGIGAASLTRKKAQKVVRALAKKGSLKASDTNKIVSAILKDANSYRKRLEAAGEAEVKKQLKNVGFRSLEEAKFLKSKARSLEKLFREKAKSAAMAAIKRM